jgi:hypothetical protein
LSCPVGRVGQRRLLGVGLEVQPAAGGRVGDAEVQLGLLGGPGFIDAGLVLERARGGDGDDGVFGRFGRDLVQFAFSVTLPLPRGYDKAPHGSALYLLRGII